MKPEKAPQTDTNASPEPSLVSINAFWAELDFEVTPECTSKDAEPYYPAGEPHAQRPPACLRCGLAEYCLTKSIEMGELRFGIWGGAVPHERRELAKLSGEERRIAIASFVAAIKKNPVKAIPEILPGRDPVPVQAAPKRTKKSKVANAENPIIPTDKEVPIKPTVVERKQPIPFVEPSAVAPPIPKQKQRTSRLRSQKPTEIVHDGIIEADEGTDRFYQQAETILGIDSLYLDESMDTRDWIEVLRAVDTQKEAVGQVAKRYYITEGTVRRQIRNMRTALKKCSPEMRNQLLGIDAA